MKRYYYKLQPIGGEETNGRESDVLLDEPFRNEIRAKVLGYHDDIPAKLDEQGNEIEPAQPKNYEIILIDRQAEIAAEQAKQEAKDAAKLAAKDAKKALKAVKDSTDLASLKLACRDLAKVVHSLVKALDIVDPTEGE